MLSIIREAAANTVKHGGTDTVFLSVNTCGAYLLLQIEDHGAGFDTGGLENAGQQGSRGIRGMRERARLIRSELKIDSEPGHGTKISLKVRARRKSGLLGKVLDHDPEKSDGGLYYFLVRLRLFMLVWTFVPVVLLISDRGYNPVLFLIPAILAVDCFVYVLFRSPVYRMLSTRPWLLAVEQIFLQASSTWPCGRTCPSSSLFTWGSP